MRCNIYAHVSRLHNDAYIEMEHWIDEHYKEVLDVQRHKDLVICRNGDKHYFMGEIVYRKWCLGRDYIIDGKQYHSGYEIGGINEQR